MKKIAVIIGALLVSVSLLFSYKTFFSPKTEVGDKCVTIEIVYSDEEINEIKEVCTNAELVLDLLTEHQEEFQLETETYDFGTMVVGLKGYNFTTLGQSKYWAFTINGEMGTVGADVQPVLDGDVYRFEATSY